jgi:predicted RNA-binding protein with PIN domain
MNLWQTIPMPYWFDGNNLIGQSAALAKANPKVRQSFLSSLSAYYKGGGGRFLIYFDGDDSSRTLPPPGVSIKYSAPLSADEYMLRRLREIRTPSEVIVVTNDRALRNRCREEGASALTWQEFVRKMEMRPSSHIKENEKTERIDLDEWIRYFGFDKTSISKK